MRQVPQYVRKYVDGQKGLKPRGSRDGKDAKK